MSNELTLIKSAIEQTGKIDMALANQYPEVIGEFAPLYQNAKSIEPLAKKLKDDFDSATDEARVEMSAQAKEIRLEVARFRTPKEGAAKVKKELKAVSDGYVSTINASFNAVSDYCKEVEADMEVIEKYADALQLRRAQALAKERTDQVACLSSKINALDLVAFGEDLGAHTPENWDIRMHELTDLVVLKELQAQQAEDKAKAEADKATIRNMRKKAFADVGYSYDGDEAELDEVDFFDVLTMAKVDYEVKQAHEKEQAEAKAKADAEKLEAMKAQAEKQRKEAQRLADIEEKRASKERIEKARAEAILQGDDAGKIKDLGSRLREIEDYAKALEMTSKKGATAKAEILIKLEVVLALSISHYNKLR